MTPDSHIKQHINMFRAAEGGLEDFRLIMNAYNHKSALSSIENCHLYILCMLCNACSLIKNYCLCDQRWEEIFITGNIYVLINESIKKIVGFKGKNDLRKRSLLDIMSTEIGESQEDDFHSIKNDLIKYADNNELQIIIQQERNLSIHYDDNFDALNLFRFQTNRNAQQAFNHFIAWFYLMNKLNALITNILDNGTKQNK